MSNRHIRAIELLTYGGLSQRDTAKVIGVSYNTVNKWLNHNEAFVTEYKRQKERTTELSSLKNREMALKALEKLNELLCCGDSKMELATAKEILSLPAVREILGTDAKPSSGQRNRDNEEEFLSLIKDLKNEHGKVY